MKQSQTEKPVELVAVINSFNRRELLENAVISLSQALKNASFGSAIVAFEAGSTDGSRQFLEYWGSENPDDNLVIVTSAGGKSSFSDGVNAGCAAAVRQFPECQWLFLYETDNWLAGAEPLAQAVTLLRNELQMAAVGFTVRLHDGRFCGYGMRFPSYTSLVLGQNLSMHWNLNLPNDSSWQMNGSVRWRTCDVVFTSPLLIRRAAWEQTGGLDVENFPFSDSDVDWAWRAAKLGWKIGVIETADVVHDNLQQKSAWSANRVIDFHRSRLRVLKRQRGNRSFLVKPLLALRHCVEIIILSFKSRYDLAARTKLDKRWQMLRSVWADYT